MELLTVYSCLAHRREIEGQRALAVLLPSNPAQSHSLHLEASQSTEGKITHFFTFQCWKKLFPICLNITMYYI